MKNKLLSLLISLSLVITPAFAEDTATVEETTTPAETLEQTGFNSAQQEMIIRDYAHYIADSYYYGVSDENLLFAIICATIENNGVFDLDLAFEAMVDILGDEYADFYTSEAYTQQTDYYNASFFGIGVVLTVQDGGTVVDSVYSGGSGEEVGIMSGDKIISVGGVDTSQMLPSDVRQLIVGEEGTTVEITVQRGSETLTFYPIRRQVSESHSSMEILDTDLAYIEVSSFTASLPDDFDSYLFQLEYNGIKNVIIDLRDNGGGDLDAAIEVAEKLIPAGLIGKIKRYKDGAQVEDIYSENYNPPNLNMLVLVNENTASASEFLAMALQSSGRAKLLGTNTFGKGCMQIMMRTPTGSGIKFTIGEFFNAADERIHTIGLTPDLPVENIVTPIVPEDFAAIDFMDLEGEQTRLGVEQRLNAVRLLTDEETDGEFNSNTEAAIRVFQQFSGLDATGVLDFYTALSINDYVYDGLYKVIDVQMEEALEYFE